DGLPEAIAFKLRSGGLRRVDAQRDRPSLPPCGPVEPGEEAGPHLEGPPRTAEPSEIALDQGSPDDGSLMQRLRQLRAGWAREAGLSPGYVLSNETLEQIARLRPRSPHDLGTIRGIGKAKLERYGSALLEAIEGAGPPVEPGI